MIWEVFNNMLKVHKQINNENICIKVTMDKTNTVHNKSILKPVTLEYLAIVIHQTPIICHALQATGNSEIYMESLVYNQLTTDLKYTKRILSELWFKCKWICDVQHCYSILTHQAGKCLRSYGTWCKILVFILTK